LEGAYEGCGNGEESVDDEDCPEGNVDAAIGGSQFEERDDERGFDEAEDRIVYYGVCESPFPILGGLDGAFGDVPVVVAIPRLPVTCP
jgi:hypothetical protein